MNLSLKTLVITARAISARNLAEDDIYFCGSTEGDFDGHTNAGNYDVSVGKIDSAGGGPWFNIQSLARKT